MDTRRRLGIFAGAAAIGILLASVVFSAPPEAPNADELLEEGLYLELARADLDGAVERYLAVLKTPSASQRTVATARLRLATAQRWRGDERRAREHLEELVRSLPSDSDVARLAQRYLGRSLDDDPARLLPEDVRFYVELVTPGESARALAALLEGTPFRNPVDYYVASLARRPPGSQDDPEPSPGAVPSEAAYLNEGFLRELELVESAALAVPNADASIGQFLAVLDPGPSNILRGLVQMGLTISRSEILGTVRDTAIFRLPALKDDPPQLAPDNHLHAGVGRDAFLLGRPRAVLEAAAERAGGRGASLADSAEFQKAKALKSGSILFAFLDLQRTVAAVRRDAKEADRPAFDAVIAACGLSRLGGVGWSLRRAVDSDALHLEAHVRVDAAGYELWQALDTEPADAAFLRSVPPCALAYLATRFERAPDRMSALFRAAQPLIELAETTRNEDALRALHAVRHAVEAGPGRVFLEEVRSFAAGIGPELSPSAPLPLFFLFDLRDAARGAQALEEAIAAAFHEALGNAASREFQDESIDVEGQAFAVRWLEPLPGFKVRAARRGKLAILTLSPQALLEVAAGALRAQAGAPERACKVVAVRPRAILEKNPASSEPSPMDRIVFEEIENAVLSTRDEGGAGPGNLVLDVELPAITPTARAVLRSLAERKVKEPGG